MPRERLVAYLSTVSLLLSSLSLLAQLGLSRWLLRRLGVRAALGERVRVDTPRPATPDAVLPLWRTILQLRRNAISTWGLPAYELEIMSRPFMGRTSFLVNEPSAIKRVLVDNHANYGRTPAGIRILRPIIGDGLFLAEGADWKHQRRTVAPAFAPRSLDVAARHIAMVAGETVADLAARPTHAIDLLRVVQRLALEPAQSGGRADVVTLIIITIGVSLFLRGLAQVVWDKRIHSLPAFSGSEPIAVGGASIVPQSLWVLGGTALAVLALGAFFNRTLAGKAMLATAINPQAAQLMGISTRGVMRASFALAAALGALGGVLTAPITLTSYEAGVMLGLKGFAAAMLGGLGSFGGAVAGGLLLGLLEAFGAGFVSSAYKDAIAFVVILAVLFFLPGGLFGARGSDRV